MSRWAALFMLAGSLTASAQAPSFRTQVDVVRVDTLVTDRGQVVRGLSASDFDVRDNGVLQDVEVIGVDELPLSVVLVFDASQSVSGERLVSLRNAGKDVLSALKAGDQAALLTFSERITLQQDLTGEFGRVREALEQMHASGWTSLVDGTFAGVQLGEADAGRDLMIVFSDGVDTGSWLTADSVVESARRSDVTVYAVVGGTQRSSFLDDLAEATGGSVIETDSSDDLSPTFLGILAEFRQRYVLTYSPQGVEQGGWHTLRVRVKGRRATITTRPGYFAR